MRLGLVLTALTILVQILAHDPLTLIGARALIGLCSGMYPAALIAYASISKVPMGRFSSFNALGWALGSLLSGVVTLIYPENYTPVFVLGSILMLASFASSLNLPAIEEKRHKIPFFPKELMLKNWHVYFPYLIRHLGANTVWAIFPLYLTLLGKGMENINFWIGLIYFVNAFSQFVFMPYLDRVKSSRSLIQGGLVCSVLVFLVYAIIPDIYYMLVAQLLLAFSWALLYVGSLRELMDNNAEKATCSGMLSSFITLAAVIGPLLGGFIAGTVAHFYGDLTGYTATLLFAAGASMVSLLLFRANRQKNE
jgi:MFS family permease